MFPEQNQPIDLKYTLVDLAHYRLADRTADGKPDPLIVHVIYTRDNEIYRDGHIETIDADTYEECKATRPNDLVNKFGKIYANGTPLLLHRRLADVVVDVAIDLRDRHGFYTMAMDGLRTYDSGVLMQKNRPDLVEAGLLARAGDSAHNRALAIDSKLFELRDGKLVEADEHGHLDDLDMTANSRFYSGPMSDAARENRLHRLQSWQRISIRNKLPIANLLAEFWDDRVPGSPADLWRIMSCRALCIGVDGNPKTNPLIDQLRNELDALHTHQKEGHFTREQFAQSAHAILTTAWEQVFSLQQRQQMEIILGTGGGKPPALPNFIFHEWLQTIHDKDLERSLGIRQVA